MSNSPYDIIASIIICTYNRASYLGRTIEHAATQVLSVGAYEIVVVDNGSTDRTADLVRSCQMAKTGGVLRYILEPELGLSVARNRGIREARGQFLCFLDDDAVPESGWLEWVVHAFMEGGTRVMCVGGRIIPLYEKPLPSWFSSTLEVTYKPVLLKDESYPTTYPQYPYGANLSIRANLVDRIGFFNTALGYKGKQLVPCEETEFLFRLEKAGYQIVMEPRATVHHLIPENRLEHAYYRRRRFAGGKGDALFEIDHFSESDVRTRWFHFIFKLTVLGLFTLLLCGVYSLLCMLAPRTTRADVYRLQCRMAERLGYSSQTWKLFIKHPRKRTGWVRPLNYKFKFG